MTHDVYIGYKRSIEWTANNSMMDDKPARRELLNNMLDSAIILIAIDVMKERYSYNMGELYTKWLTNYVIKRHNK